ncbi:MAG: hypothetical protein ABI898_12445 [Sphingomonadales bacterium]
MILRDPTRRFEALRAIGWRIAEVVMVFIVLRVITLAERGHYGWTCEKPYTSMFCRVPWDGLRLHIVLALIAYWTARVSVRGGCVIAALYVIGLMYIILMAGALYMPFDFELILLVVLPISGHLLGRGLRRRHSK